MYASIDYGIRIMYIISRLVFLLDIIPIKEYDDRYSKEVSLWNT